MSALAGDDVALEHDRAAGELARRLLGVAHADPRVAAQDGGPVAGLDHLGQLGAA